MTLQSDTVDKPLIHGNMQKQIYQTEGPNTNQQTTPLHWERQS